MGATSLFDSTLTQWVQDSPLAVASWLKSRGLQDSSIEVYLSMWNKLLSHLESKKISLISLKKQDLLQFLDINQIDSGHRYRYTRLVERVFDQMASVGFAGLNPGRVAAKTGEGNGIDAPTVFLNPKELNSVLQLISTDRSKDWKRVRNLAVTAVQLGAGVKVGELGSRLTVNCIIEAQHKISIPSRTGRPRYVRLLPEVESAIYRWKAMREGLNIPGETLFPGVRTTGDAMNEASFFRATKSILAEAGVIGPRSSGQTLRNSFVARLIDAGTPDDLIMEYLGFNEPLTVSRLRQAYAAFLMECHINTELD